MLSQSQGISTIFSCLLFSQIDDLVVAATSRQTSINHFDFTNQFSRLRNRVIHSINTYLGS